MKDLEGKVIFLTGGAQGIGRECALAYSRAGARVAIADIDLDAATQTVLEIGAENLALSCDVSRAESVAQAVEQTLQHYSRIDAVHNNAGLSAPAKPLHETTEHEWDLLQRVNLKSVYLTTRYAIDALKASRGCILNTASVVGLIGQTNHAAYVAMKGGMVSLTKAMALDYAPDGIRVNAICPAGVWTPMLSDWANQQPDPAAIEQFLNEVHPLGDCPQGDVIADAAVFLLSDRARFMTGCIMPVSGGAELGYRR